MCISDWSSDVCSSDLEYCGACHGWNGAYLGKVIPITEIGTDRERFDTWSQEDADATNAVAKEMGVERKNMVKDVGYVSQPLDGVWLQIGRASCRVRVWQ